MFSKKNALTFFLFLFYSVNAWAGSAETTKKIHAAYNILKSNRVSYSRKKEAVQTLNNIWEKTKDPLVVDSAVKLLTYFFDQDNFREEKQQMYDNDRIAGSLIKLIHKTRSPKAFRILAIYVSKRNHTDATIQAAWQAIQNIDWTQQKEDKDEK